MLRLTAVALVLTLGAIASAEDKKADGAAAGDPLHPRLKMETTLGDIVLELDGEKAPISTENFIRYANDGYYNGTIFHRVISNFMIQGGGFTAEMDEKSKGLRAPIKNEWKNGLKNVRGSIAMARKPAPDSATAQFFINVVDNKMLDRPQRGAAYAVFGKVVEGMDVVDKIRDAEVIKHPKYQSPKRTKPTDPPVTPKEPIIIKAVTLLDDLTMEAVANAIKKAEEEAKMTAKNEAETRAKSFADLLANGKDENGAELKKTESGLQYVALKSVAEGATPKPTDTVEVHYSGWLMNGTEFDSSVKRGKPAKFPLNGVIKGWTEGVGMMKVGEKWRFVIPPDLAYGSRGRPSIPPNSTLVFDVELLSIK